MDAPLILALARARVRAGNFAIQDVWVSPRALFLRFAPERQAGLETGLGWLFLLTPSPELWLLHEKDPALAPLKTEAKGDLSRRWALELKGARLEDVEGDPRERWLGLRWRRRALTGRIEVSRLAFQAIPGRAGLRLDGLDLNPVRLGLGQPFPADPPQPDRDPPALLRWRERFGPRLDLALAGELPDVLEGVGSLLERHRAWSLGRADTLVLAPRRQAETRRIERERARLQRYGEALAQDRARHQKTLELRRPAEALAAELWRLKGAQGTVTLLDGTSLDLPEGWRAEEAVQRWFAAVKRAERGLLRVAELEREHRRQVLALKEHHGPTLEIPPKPSMVKSKPKEARRPMEPKRIDQRSDGKGRAFRSLLVEGMDVLIGKGDADNDALTFKVASPWDFWLHVAGVPGSHVVIRNPDRLSEPPRSVLERAAELAAWYSKAREAGKVEVHWCRVADVSKPRGFPPGKVLLKSFKSLRVYPKA